MAISLLLLLSTSLLFPSCSGKPSHVTQVDATPCIFPDYAGTTIPVDIAPLNFNAVGSDAEAVYVKVKGSKGGEVETSGDYADFDVDDWHQLTERNKGGKLIFSVCIKRSGDWKQYRDFTVNVSADALGEWGLTYRLIPPGYEVYGKMGLYQRDLSNFDEQAILENTAVPARLWNSGFRSERACSRSPRSEFRPLPFARS